MKRPKGYRKRRDQECFYNAQMLAIEDRGRYVEGYAQSRHLNMLVHHAWITLDGVHAIDPTWQEPGAKYIGIEVDTVTLAKAMCAKGFTEAHFNLPCIAVAS